MSQFEGLLLEVSKQISATAATVEGAVRRMEELAREHMTMRERISRIETAQEKEEEWSGEERRRVEGRLGSGDQTFLRIDQQIRDAADDAAKALEVAGDALKAIDAHTSGTHGETGIRKKTFLKWAEILFPIVWPLILTGVTWLFTTLHFLAKLQEAAKASGGHP